MPREGMSWYHVMWHTYGTWLPGDPRGFRNRDHRIHSSGDYKNPPPEGEHEGLHRYAKRVSKDEVVLASKELRKEVCEALLDTIKSYDYRAIALTVCRVHVHLVIELPSAADAFDKAMTDIKTRSSGRVKNKPTSRLWARKWKQVFINDAKHREDEIVYVRDKQGRSNCAWTHRDGFVRTL